MTKQKSILDAVFTACHVDGIESLENACGYQFDWVDDAQEVIDRLKRYHPTARWVTYSSFQLFGAVKDKAAHECLVKLKDKGGWLYYRKYC